MDNKNDWEELEKWEQNRIENDKSKYGVEYKKIERKSQNKKIDSLVRKLKIIENFAKVITIIISCVGFLALLIYTYFQFANLKERTDVEVKKTIENNYNVKIKIISKDVDEKENGTYRLELRDNTEIKFTAIKNYGSLTEDYLDNCQKYYFDKWISLSKQQFIINENINNGILEFETYIEINTSAELEKGMNAINEFVDYCGKNFCASWNIYLKKGEHRIYPYQQSEMTAEEATNNAKELYKEYTK